MENEIIKTTENTAERAALLDSRINANAKIIAESFVTIGRDFKAMRDEKLYIELGCESFEDYCDKKTPIKQRQAYNFIKCYEKYGERLDELSGIGITKLTLMSALDDEDREELIQSGDAENLSTRELEKRIKELQSQNEQLTLELGEMSKEESKLEKMQNEIEKLQAELAAQKDIQAQKDEHIKALESKPVEVAVEKPSKEEIAKIEKAAADKAKKAAKKQYEKEIAELREKNDEMRITAVNAAREESKAEIERLKSENAVLQSNAKKAPPSTQKERVKFHIEECLRNFNAAMDSVNALPEDERDKPTAALKSMVEKMGELVLK